jgi:AraC family transcriptional regulator
MKGVSMDGYYQQAIKRVLRHIDSHLDETLSLEDLSKVAKVSTYHFHRLFTGYMGISLGQFIKRRRIERSMSQLAYTKNKTIQVALSSGYDSHAGFTKAFGKEMGMTPTEFRNQMQHKKGEIMMHLKNAKVEFVGFVERPDCPVFYIRRMGSYYVSPSEAWKKLKSILVNIDAVYTPGEYMGISHDNPHDADIEEEALRFDACIAQEKRLLAHKASILQQGAEEGILSGGRYAVFRHRGPFEHLGESFHYIYGSWIYTEDQKLRDAPPFVRMPYVFDPSRTPATQESDIHIPVK